jgi:3-isopropylmalate/(R)-2-methylmalate dehydratase small subunit
MTDTGKKTVLEGRVHVIVDSDGKPIDNIDTDMIFHNAHLAITEIGEMGRHAFGNLEGWEDFPGKAKAGDILVVGGNFGAGSSRQQAVDCFRALGITAVVGESFGAIYLRNAINSGMPILSVPGIMDTGIASGDTIRLDLEKSIVTAERKDLSLPAPRPFSKVQLDIYRAGSLFKVQPGT